MLLYINRCPLFKNRVDGWIKAPAHMSGNGECRNLFHKVLHITFCKGGSLGNLNDDFLIVIGNLQFFCKQAAQLTATAAKLTSNRNNLIHKT